MGSLYKKSINGFDRRTTKSKKGLHKLLEVNQSTLHGVQQCQHLHVHIICPNLPDTIVRQQRLGGLIIRSVRDTSHRLRAQLVNEKLGTGFSCFANISEDVLCFGVGPVVQDVAKLETEVSRMKDEEGYVY